MINLHRLNKLAVRQTLVNYLDSLFKLAFVTSPSHCLYLHNVVSTKDLEIQSKSKVGNRFVLQDIEKFYLRTQKGVIQSFVHNSNSNFVIIDLKVSQHCDV